MQDLRADLGLGTIPFLAGEFPFGGSCAGHTTLANQLPSVVASGHVVSASGLVVDRADTQHRVHVSHDSQVTLGTRYAQQLIEVLGL